MSKAEVIEIGSPFKVYKLPYGSYMTNREDKPLRIFFPDGQELDVSNWDVFIYDNGIEIYGVKKK